MLRTNKTIPELRDKNGQLVAYLQSVKTDAGRKLTVNDFDGKTIRLCGESEFGDIETVMMPVDEFSKTCVFYDSWKDRRL